MNSRCIFKTDRQISQLVKLTRLRFTCMGYNPFCIRVGTRVGPRINWDVVWNHNPVTLVVTRLANVTPRDGSFAMWIRPLNLAVNAWYIRCVCYAIRFIIFLFMAVVVNTIETILMDTSSKIQRYQWPHKSTFQERLGICIDSVLT